MKGGALAMAEDPNTKDTLPPPNGAEDAYSARTRVGTLPEHVLEAMRRQESDALLQKRTKSGMQSAASAQSIPSSGVVPTIHTPQEGWLAGASPLNPSLPLPRPPTPAPMPPTLLSARPLAVKPNVWRSVAIVAIFALLGALLAAFITRAGF